MPCNSDYMKPHNRERCLSQVACLLDELDGLGWSSHDWQGYHPSIYCKTITKEKADKMVADLCGRLQSLDVSRYSLEMQMWWRDHQQADVDRLQRELMAEKHADERAAAIAKLTPYERKLLNID